MSPSLQFVTFEDESGLLEAAVEPPFDVNNPGPWLVDGGFARDGWT